VLKMKIGLRFPQKSIYMFIKTPVKDIVSQIIKSKLALPQGLEPCYPDYKTGPSSSRG
jgi:hypothetical protein